MLLIVTFSLGLAGTLTALGVAVVPRGALCRRASRPAGWLPSCRRFPPLSSSPLD